MVTAPLGKSFANLSNAFTKAIHSQPALAVTHDRNRHEGKWYEIEKRNSNYNVLNGSTWTITIEYELDVLLWDILTALLRKT